MGRLLGSLFLAFSLTHAQNVIPAGTRVLRLTHPASPPGLLVLGFPTEIDGAFLGAERFAPGSLARADGLYGCLDCYQTATALQRVRLVYPNGRAWTLEEGPPLEAQPIASAIGITSGETSWR